MRNFRFFLLLFPLILFACSIGGIAPLAATQAVPVVSESAGKKCGDGICGGPENASLCAQDCTSSTTNPSGNAATAGNLTPGTKAHTYWMINPASGAKLFISVSYGSSGDSLLPAIVMIPGGLGAQDLENGTDIDAIRLAAAGYVVIQFDADGRGSSDGVENHNGFIHQDGLAALILAAGQIPQVDPARLGVISRSYGVTMASGALGRYPTLPVRFYIDWEGPADRNYTTSGCTGINRGIDWPSCDDDAFWSERESVNYIGAVRVPYLRIQSAKDHVQSTNSHAVDMVNAAIQGGVPWVRLNDEPENQTYDPVHPPEMLPDTIDRQLPDLFIGYAEELFALEW